jgi:hypothetical protein
VAPGEWHRTYGHLHVTPITPDAIRALVNKGAEAQQKGVKLIDDRGPLLCDSCEYADGIGVGVAVGKSTHSRVVVAA